MRKVAQNNVKFTKGLVFPFFIQPYGRDFVIALPYWLFSSIFNIFIVILFLPFFCFILFILASYISVKSSASFFDKSIWNSNARRVFTELKPPIRVLSKSLTCSASVARAIKHLLCHDGHSHEKNWKDLLSSPRFSSFIVWYNFFYRIITFSVNYCIFKARIKLFAVKKYIIFQSNIEGIKSWFHPIRNDTLTRW